MAFQPLPDVSEPLAFAGTGRARDAWYRYWKDLFRRLGPLVIDATTGALSRDGNGGIPVQGTNTNDSAASGNVGEAVVNTGGGLSLATNTPLNITSISLTAGDWDVSALASFTGAGITVTSNITVSISNTSATQDSTNGRQVLYRFNGGSGHADLNFATSIPPYRISLAATTTIYLVATVTFTTSTYNASGRLYARRMR